jgi:hypothetical protein
MAEEGKSREPQSVKDFEKRFREAFGRDMTAEERRWFRLTEIVDDREEEPESDDKSDHAA